MLAAVLDPKIWLL